MINKYKGPCLYRGKSIKTGKWVYGDHSNKAPSCTTTDTGWIIGDVWTQIDPNTLSAWTGLEDKNGVKIFGGDIVNYGDSYFGSNFEAVFNTDRLQFILSRHDKDGFQTKFDITHLVKVIGNIWDNPELLEKQDV